MGWNDVRISFDKLNSERMLKMTRIGRPKKDHQKSHKKQGKKTGPKDQHPSAGISSPWLCCFDNPLYVWCRSCIPWGRLLIPTMIFINPWGVMFDQSPTQDGMWESQIPCWLGFSSWMKKRLFFLGTAEVPFTNQPKGQKSLEKDPFQILDVFVSGDVFTFQQ